MDLYFFIPYGIVIVAVFFLCEICINTYVHVPNRTLSGAYSGVTVVVFVGKTSEFLPIAIFVVVDLQNNKNSQCGGLLYLPSISVQSLTWVVSSRNKNGS
jgi:hypothetical protein